MEFLLAHCNAAFSGRGNIFFLFFLGGLTGSLTHCLSMCGPLVACHTACSGKCGSNLRTSSLWRYHAGRVLVYSLLGFFTSYFSRQLIAYDFWPTLAAIMMGVAAALFIGSALMPTRSMHSPKAGRYAFLSGVSMGFMPCGLLYAALMLAATIPNPLAGMTAMLCFSLGTLPMLLATSGAAAVLSARWKIAVARAGRIGLTINGIMLLIIAEKIVR